jgi:hypothetical protein
MADEYPKKLVKLRIKSGQHAGRYIGPRFGGGLVTNPEVRNNPPVNLPGTKYAARAVGGTHWFHDKVKEAQSQLKSAGYETGVVEVPEGEKFIKPDPTSH